MIRFDSSKVKPSSHLAVLTYRQTQAIIRERKALDRKATETVKRVRDFTAPVKENFVPRGFGRRNNPIVGLSSAKRAVVQLKTAQRTADRAAFFAAI